MRVFQINSVCGVRSTGRIVADIYDELAENGHECKVAYGRLNGRGVPDKDAVRICTKAGVYADAVLSRITGRNGEFSSAATVRLIKEIENFRPDIIHLHNLHGYYLNVFMLFDYLRKTQIPVVWTLHDCWAFTGHCAYFDMRGCKKWETGCGKCPAKREYPKSLFFDRAERQYAMKKSAFTALDKMVIVTPSVWLKNLAGKSFLSKFPCKVIQNGINPEIFRPSASDKKELPCSRPYILGVALPFTERKGFSDFIKLSGIVNDKYETVLVGVDVKQKKLLPAGITGIERTDSAADLAKLYSGAECFFNLTYEDNFPTTNIESLMCGTPVITYDTGGSPESIDENSGATVKKGDVFAAADKLSGVIELKDRGDIASAAKARFDRRVMARNYLSLYESVLSGK